MFVGSSRSRTFAPDTTRQARASRFFGRRWDRATRKDCPTEASKEETLGRVVALRDDDLLSRAREVSGASTMKETVHVALRTLVETELRRRHLQRLESLEGLDLADDAVMGGAWR